MENDMTDTTVTVHCDGWCGESKAERSTDITHIDAKGYAYCTPCGRIRQEYQNCRKLRPHELNRILRGEQLTRY